MVGSAPVSSRASRHWRQARLEHQPVADNGHRLRLPRLCIASQPPLAALPVGDLGRVAAEHEPVEAFLLFLPGALGPPPSSCRRDEQFALMMKPHGEWRGKFSVANVLLADVLVQLCSSKASAGEVCRFAGTTHPAGHIAVTTKLLWRTANCCRMTRRTASSGSTISASLGEPATSSRIRASNFPVLATPTLSSKLHSVPRRSLSTSSSFLCSSLRLVNSIRCS